MRAVRRGYGLSLLGVLSLAVACGSALPVRAQSPYIGPTYRVTARAHVVTTARLVVDSRVTVSADVSLVRPEVAYSRRFVTIRRWRRIPLSPITQQPLPVFYNSPSSDASLVLPGIRLMRIE